VILRIDLNPADLPREKVQEQEGIVTSYLVNEEDARIETIDEIEEFPAAPARRKRCS